MNILLLNQNWFAPELRKLGHKVVSFGRHNYLELLQPKFLMTWSEIKEALPSGFVPDLLIIYDDSSPLTILNAEQIDIPTIFYSVDTHHHLSFHRYLGLTFNNFFVAQKDYISEFDGLGYSPYWLPLWASEYMEPSDEKKYGAVFVGTLNPRLNPGRVKFFEELTKISAVTTMTDNFMNVFPYSQIVINQTVKADLNFRVFESMMSGAMLLTERIANGLDELFEDGTHLVLYEKGNIQEASDKIDYYLKHPELAKKIGLAGRNIICEKHLPQNRIETVLKLLDKPTRPTSAASAFGMIPNFCALRHGLSTNGETVWSTRAMLEVMRLTQVGLGNGEKIYQEIATCIMKAMLSIEPMLKKESLHLMLDDLIRTYPDMGVFNLVKIDTLVREGQNDLAREVAKIVSNISETELIEHARSIVDDLRAN